MAWWNNGSSIANSLSAYWKCDEVSGTRVDQIHGYNLTDNNSTPSADGYVYPLAASFNGSNQTLSIPSNADLTMGDIQFFVVAWVYLTSKPAQVTAVGKNEASTNLRSYFLSYNSSNDRLAFNANTTGSGASTAVSANGLGSPALNTWYLLAGWHDPVANLLWVSVNGGEPESVAFSGGALANTTVPFRIGGSGITATQFWPGRVGPVAVGKNYMPTIQDLHDIYREGPVLALNQWWLGNGQIDISALLEHVETPDSGQAYAGVAVASGQPWTLAVRSWSYLASASVGRYLFDSQNGRFIAGIGSSNAYGFYTGAWSNAALFNSAADQVWFFVSDGTHIQAYLNNVATGTNVASTVGLATAGQTRWGRNYDNAAVNLWNNPIICGAVYNKALTLTERRGLLKAMQNLNTDTDVLTSSATWVALNGITEVDVVCRGPGGNGGNGTGGNGSNTAGSGGGGGGGAYAASTSVAVTGGNGYVVTVGTGGSGTATEIVADSETVRAAAGGNGGAGTTGTGGGGGAGGAVANSIGAVLFAGGNGGPGRSTATLPCGGGGGGSAGSTGNGGVGGTGSLNSSVGVGGSAGAGGGASGGSGGPAQPIGNGAAGGIVGGGGGGAGGVSPSVRGVGSRGQVDISWVYPAPTTSIAPAVAGTVATTVADPVVKGAVSFTPVPAAGIATTVAPVSLLGSVVVTPPAASVRGQSLADPVALSSVLISASPAQARSTALSGGAFASSVSLTPAAAVGVAVAIADPVNKGSIVTVPTPAQARVEALSDGARRDAIALSPAATAARGETVAPTLVKGSAIAGPAPVTVMVRTLGGQVQGSGAILAPDPADAHSAVVAPTLSKSSILVSPAPALAVAVAVAPVAVKGSLALATAPAQGVVVTVAPVVIKNSVVLATTPAQVRGDSHLDLVILGSVLLSVFVDSGSSVVLGSVDIGGSGAIVVLPEAAEAIGSTRGPAKAATGLFEAVDKAMFIGVFKGMR